MTRLVDPVLNLQGLPVYAIVGALVFAEAAIFVGFVFPGETAAILGGVIASRGNVALDVLVPLVVVCAIVGDTVGYVVGRVLGPRLLRLGPLKKRQKGLEAAVGLIRRRGPWAVFVGRFTAFLRAVVPGLAGVSEMHYPTFLLANAAGGIVWGVGFVLLGYVAGDAYRRVESASNVASEILIGLIVVVIAALIVRRAIRARRDRRAESGAQTRPSE